MTITPENAHPAVQEHVEASNIHDHDPSITVNLQDSAELHEHVHPLNLLLLKMSLQYNFKNKYLSQIFDLMWLKFGLNRNNNK